MQDQWQWHTPHYLPHAGDNLGCTWSSVNHMAYTDLSKPFAWVGAFPGAWWQIGEIGRVSIPHLHEIGYI